MKKTIKIQYSIVSRGTEKYNNYGYMAISEKIDHYNYILNINHGIKIANYDENNLKINAKFNIQNIAFSRFQLIAALMYEQHKSNIFDNILLLGLGNIGITCLFYLLDKNYTNITIYIKEKREYIKNLSKTIYDAYKININFIYDLENLKDFKTIIDTTGSSIVLKNAFEKVEINTTFIILSTPRENSYLISPLVINRKNLTIIGGHEFNGISIKSRNKLMNKLLVFNEQKQYIKEFVNIYDYSLNKLENIKNNKDNFIELFRY